MPGGIGKLLMVVVAAVAPCHVLLGQRTDAARIDLGVSVSVGSRVNRLGAALLGGLRLPVSSSVAWRPGALLMVTMGSVQGACPSPTTRSCRDDVFRGMLGLEAPVMWRERLEEAGGFYLLVGPGVYAIGETGGAWAARPGVTAGIGMRRGGRFLEIGARRLASWQGRSPTSVAVTWGRSTR